MNMMDPLSVQKKKEKVFEIFKHEQLLFFCIYHEHTLCD